MASASPNAVHVYDPATSADQTIPLSRAPLSFSLSLDGRHAAVGHDGAVSYVNLQTLAVEKTLILALRVERLVLGNGFIYITSGFGPLSLLNISSGAVTAGSDFFAESVRLHPSGNYLYSVSSTLISRYDLQAASNAAKVGSIPASCGNLWLSLDGARIYTACGSTVHASTDPLVDMTTGPPLQGLQAAAGIHESATAGRIAAITGEDPFSTPSPVWDQVRLYDTVSLREAGRFRLPGFSSGGLTYAAHGRWVFFNNASSSLHVIVQADASSGVVNDFAVRTFSLASPAPCFASFSSATVEIPSSGALAEVGISAAADCVFRAASSAAWVQTISGAYGSGDSTLRLHVRSNTGASARTATVAMGTQTLTISQAGSPATPVVPQRLSYRVSGAEYSKALNRIIAVSAGPDEVHIIDPVTRTEQFIPLGYPPLSISVEPDGLKAAVGHMDFVSYLNLQTASVERVYPMAGNAVDVVAAGNGYVYVMNDTWLGGSQVRSIQLSNGARTTEQRFSNGPARLHPSRNAIYTRGHTYLERWDIRSGPASFQRELEQTAGCTNLWLSEDGVRLFNNCGFVYRISEVPQQDGTPGGSLVAATGNSPVAPAVLSLSHSSARSMIAVLPGTTRFSPNDWHWGEIQLYADNGLVLQGRLRLTPFVAATRHEVQGRHVFWNAASDRLFVISQVNPSSGLLSDFVLETVLPAAITNCAATLSQTSANVSGNVHSLDVSVSIGPDCVWEAQVGQNDTWISVPSGRGTGSGTITLGVSSNIFTPAARSAVVLIAGQQFTVNQAASSGILLSFGSMQFHYSGGSSFVGVATSATNRSWTASSNAPWITFANGSGTGGGTFTLMVAANSGAARTATVTVGPESFTVTQDANPQAPGTGMRFVPVTPCRVVDTRNEGGAVRGPRTFVVAGRCGVPAAATAYSLNVTVVPESPLGYLTIWPAISSVPFVSTLNSLDGRVKANAAIVPGAGGAVSVFVTDPTHVILDVNGYFVSSAGANTSIAHAFNAVKPCRVADTRAAAGPNGGPSFAAGQTRNFSIRAVAGCDTLPVNAAAYSLNITAIPKSAALGYLTVWGAGGAQPFVSTLNSFTGTVVANAAIVPAGANGDISAFVTDAADVVIDINGYFGPGGSNPLLYYPTTPCRISDSREAPGTFGGPILTAGQGRNWPVPGSACGLPSNANAYVLNATVVPSATLGYLTLWPSGAAQPLVSTLNSFDGSITANAAIVPAGVGGAVSSFVSNDTHLILDTTGYFAP
ncbi:MAG: BACON domain-containing protein [Bryobacteraceae bacterium]|nr:BACON domain-containing protein [Bryobacteraceae bacterium]